MKVSVRLRTKRHSLKDAALFAGREREGEDCLQKETREMENMREEEEQEKRKKQTAEVNAEKT